jgi:ribosomal protein S18 acetylase RimI-like enzyme
MKTRSTFTIRRTVAEDSEAILGCLREAFEPYRTSYTPSAFSDTVLSAETIDRRLAEMIVLVAVGDRDNVVGTISYAIIDGDEGHIRGMAVRPEWQGQGVAQRLLDAVESTLRRGACTRISLDTTEPLRRAIGFYERNGFARSGRVTDFFGMPLFEYVKSL